jgi:hypothetical protein
VRRSTVAPSSRSESSCSDPVALTQTFKRLGIKRQTGMHRHLRQCCPAMFWWAPRESNPAPTDYESAALTRHELEARIPVSLPRKTGHRRAPAFRPLHAGRVMAIVRSSGAMIG